MPILSNEPSVACRMSTGLGVQEQQAEALFWSLTHYVAVGKALHLTEVSASICGRSDPSPL